MNASIKTGFGKLIAGTLLVAASSFAAAGISTTKHNLGSGGTGNNKFSGTGEICVFCHTPHGSDTAASVPLWNRDISTPPTYQTYADLNTSSLDGEVAPVGSVSLACLSCHDGTQAMDAVLNEPGSGKVVASYSTSGTWTGSSSPTGIALIGQDLRNDHPVGIQYAGGGFKDSDKTAGGGANIGDADFNTTDVKNKTVNGQTVWWIDTAAGTANTREKTDIQLYTRTVASAANEPEPFVECASCHDPHTNNTTFLRINNSGSAVCLACHTK